MARTIACSWVTRDQCFYHVDGFIPVVYKYLGICGKGKIK